MKLPDKKIMSSAPFVYDGKGNIMWNEMWDLFCILAKEGGPAHRDTVLKSKGSKNDHNKKYKEALKEILRAIPMISKFHAYEASLGFIGIKMGTSKMAKWFCDQINTEHVECIRDRKVILLPVNDDFEIDKETKNVVTVVAKTYHYWSNHRNPLSKFLIKTFGIDIKI